MPYAKASSPSSLPKAVDELVQHARQNNQTLVLATGVFDILHQEHLHFLEKAKAVGDVLLVGIESDQRVRQLKGEGRPINTELIRWQNLDQLRLADAVFVLPDQFGNREDYVLLIETIRPQILAVSSHTLHIDRKQAVMKLVGGEVRVVHDHNPAISTTQILNQRSNQ
jgi:rfaE bifunctional protein nucleotidyltransferase chain/domain